MLPTITDEKLTLADSHLSSCHLCERHCGVDRWTVASGFCKATQEARVFRHRIEYGEEAQLVPSHLFYTSGCDLRCKFCIAEENAFNPRSGTLLTTEFLQAAIEWGRTRGARNIQFVGGEPTIHLPAILRALSSIPNLPPIVWKSDFYGSVAAFELLAGVANVFVADFKFGNDLCAKSVANVENYLAVVSRNLKLAYEMGDLIVRHLLLPGHFECCYRPIVQWISKNLPHVKFSLRDGYLPRWNAQKDASLNRVIGIAEARLAREFACSADLNLIA